MKPSMELKGKQAQTRAAGIAGGTLMGLSGLILMVLFAGCQTAPPEPTLADFDIIRGLTNSLATPGTNAATKAEVLVLQEGDMVRVTFPGATALNGPAQAIRRDGIISLPPLGEIKASGLTTKQLEKAILEKFGSQLQTKEVNVVLEAAGFSVYVTGAVLRPGKVTAERPLTALEAVMEAGGPDYTKANLKKVTVIRAENSHTERHVVNLRRVLDGQSAEPFKLKPADILYVPERFKWF